MITIQKISGETSAFEEEIEKLLCKNDRENGNEDLYNLEKFAYALVNEQGDTVGGITGWKVFCEIYIDEICVERAYRGQGYGRKLLKIVEQEIDDGNCDNINLVTTSFLNALKFYEKNGFEIAFINKNSKDSRFDKYYMKKSLSK